MAERKKAKKKGKEVEVVCEVPLKPSKDEYAIAKFLRNNLPTKRTKFLQHTVEFFTASKAIDLLMDSPWSSDKSKTAVKFTTRDEIVEFMDIMLRHKFFHRARRVPITARDLRGKALKKFQEEQERLKELERKKAERDKKKRRKEGKKDEAGDPKTSGDEKSPSDNEGKKDDEQKKEEADDEKEGEADKDKGKDQSKIAKRRIKLEMHLDQVFLDGNDAYVWIYDPTPWYYWLLSILVVLGAIALCLFPLWPSSVRKGVYYLSLAAAGFLIFILGLAVLRMVVFCLIWGLTFGRHHLWLLPNLTEDVGFFASFWPLFQYEYKGSGSKDKKKKKKGKKEEDEDDESSGSGSEGEDSEESKETDTEKSKNKKKAEESSAEKEDQSSVPPSPAAPERTTANSKDDDEDEGSQSSRNSQQTDKDFEIIGSADATEEDVPDPE